VSESAALVAILRSIVEFFTGGEKRAPERRREQVREEMEFVDEYRWAYRRRVYNRLIDRPSSECEEVGVDRTEQLRSHKAKAEQLLGHQTSREYQKLIEAEELAQHLWAFDDRVDAGHPLYGEASNRHQSVVEAVDAILARGRLVVGPA
jgi:hypothetical protein